MNLLRLSIAYLRARRLTNSLLVLLLALGIATMSLLLHFSISMQDRLTRDARGIDLVVGAKGSPLQLILSSIYHLDIPTGNIPLAEANGLRHRPDIKLAIPLALGDNYHGMRIVGTEPSYITHYGAELTQGRLWKDPLETVIGANVARENHLGIGNHFVGSHGLIGMGDEHKEFPYTVVGIMKPTGTVLDRLILTPVESVWKIHQHHDPDDIDEDPNEHPEQEITALLIAYRSPISAMSMPREINRNSSMQAASPAFELARLLKLLGLGIETLQGFGIILMGSALIGMLISIYQSMQERRYDLAIMRVLGADKATLLRQILLETALLLALGICIGLAFSHIGLALLPNLFAQLQDVSLYPLRLLPEEIVTMALLFAGGLIVAVIPALHAYKVNLSHILSHG